MKRIKLFFVLIIAVSILSFGTAREDYFEIAKQMEIFTTFYKELNLNYVDPLNHAEMIETAIQGMLLKLDPYTVFYNEQRGELAKISQADESVSIGADIDYKNGQILIRDIYQNQVADQAKLKIGDRITEVNRLSVSKYGEEAINLLKGISGTSIDIKYLRQGQPKSTKLVFKTSKDNDLTFHKKIDDEIGYISLSVFEREASKQIKEALLDLKANGVKSIIIDLRGNPGGLLFEAIKIVNIFVPKGKLIVSTQGKLEEHNQYYKTKAPAIDLDIPIAVLVNEHSASASEIVSGSLQDLDRAVVLGTKSYGKGLVQIPMELIYGTYLKTTISRYHTPSGRCIQAIDYSRQDKNGKAIKVDHFKKFTTKNGRPVFDGGGIKPDIEVTMMADENNEYYKAMMKNDLIFDFANDYYFSNPTREITNNFTIGELDFKRFKEQYVSSADVTSALGVYLKKYKEENKKLNSALTENINQTMTAIKQDKLAFLEKNRKEITILINRAIVKRYLYNKGLNGYKLDNDKVIQRAKELLHNPSEYKKILKI